MSHTKPSVKRVSWFRLSLASSLMAGACLMGNVRGEEPPVAGAPLFKEATTEFTKMKSTLYQHQTRVDQVTGSYSYDCVGFVSYALKQAAPQAWASAFKATGIEKGRIPSPARYRAFFASLATAPQLGWKAVTQAADLRPGDVVAWEQKTESATGHAVVIGGTPVALPDDAWLVQVYDSTSSPHGADSRPGDERAQVLAATGRHSGLGHGEMVFVADPASGALIGYRWSLKAKTSIVPIAAGRATS